SGRCRSKNKMSSGAAPTNPVNAVSSPPAELWHELLKRELERSPQLTEQFYEKLRAAKLTFGNRVHCPFLRPFFLSSQDEQRVRIVAGKLGEFGGRISGRALDDAALLAQLAFRAKGPRPVRLAKPAGLHSTAPRPGPLLPAHA